MANSFLHTINFLKNGNLSLFDSYGGESGKEWFFDDDQKTLKEMHEFYSMKDGHRANNLIGIVTEYDSYNRPITIKYHDKASSGITLKM